MVTGSVREAEELGQLKSTLLKRRMFTVQHHRDSRACWVNSDQMQDHLGEQSLSVSVRDLPYSDGWDGKAHPHCRTSQNGEVWLSTNIHLSPVTQCGWWSQASASMTSCCAGLHPKPNQIMDPNKPSSLSCFY